jgi:hypothetical protein
MAFKIHDGKIKIHIKRSEVFAEWVEWESLCPSSQIMIEDYVRRMPTSDLKTRLTRFVGTTFFKTY